MHAQREDAGQDVGASAREPLHPHPRITSFRARHAGLTDRQEETWARRWPDLGAEARNADGSPAAPLDAAAWFGRRGPLVLEIGCGAGTSTHAMALEEPDLDVIAVEVYRKGLAQLMGAVERDGLTNIRFVRGDGVDVLEHMLEPGSLTGIRVFFPDPWPKSRHHKRRLLQPATVALMADRLKPGGVLHAATDHAEYAEQIAEVGDGEPQLERIDPDRTDLPISVRRPETKYEARGLRAGSAITELLWQKRDRR
ncbi:tRNA (guanosine(46)-N7)-methyltransferase TrmB [Mycolicibacterium sediminis]|uniref:tRNA (guanine-N(7)-)-methyltransferase n=1 Tax=Mycolicibacterium sediminis TaxID=1286180 RepID=A0A7I7QM81_9MYCO|nr:tRNA (guanosine(46)-N7)-methyltransferase TrmB [Mycolicibacterium sediminis]BBY27411.1 tRNA (guanine-N(7)-)-methyltransferase [Mycolicibacterium sediminis]